MKKLPFALSLAGFLGGGPLALAVPATADLTLVNEDGFNEIEIGISNTAGLINPASDTSLLSGEITVELEIDPPTGEVSELTIIDGTVVGTGLDLSGTGFLLTYEFTADSIGASLLTPSPPGLVDPATGEFDAAQHSFAVNQGTLNGSITFFGSATTIDPFDFAVAPVEGPGNGTGTVNLTLTETTPTSKTFDVVVTVPISIVDVFMVEDPITATIDVAADGVVKAAGAVTIPVTPADPYLAWAEANSLPGALFSDDANGDGVPNGLQWALGLGSATSPFPFLLQPMSGHGATVEFTLTLPPGGSAADLIVLGSDNPETSPFTALAPGAVSVGNPIPAGTSGTVTISLLQNEMGFVRLGAEAPGD